MYFGGGAGGGKTDLAVGLALTAHKRTLILRRESTQLGGVIERLKEILADLDGRRIGDYNDQRLIWRQIPGGRLIQLGGCKELDDRQARQGIPFDLMVFDEAPQFLKDQITFIIGWNRTSVKGQRCRVLLTGNPPTTPEGEWIVARYAPWLDREHPNPALPGEMRWYIRIPGGDELEVDGPAMGTERPDPIEYEMPMPDGSTKLEMLYPKSRTFIPARVTDNPVYMRDPQYLSQLQAMPEPLRTQMLYGDHSIGMEDDEYQVIPTRWVIEAQNRWLEWHKTHVDPPSPMDALGTDVARGGVDTTALMPRHGTYFAEPIEKPGRDTPDGRSVAQMVLSTVEGKAVVLIDVIGIGAAAFDVIGMTQEAEDDELMEAVELLQAGRVEVIPINFGARTKQRDITKKFGFANKRALYYWRFREMLDPSAGQDIMLPPGPKVRADLCAPRWKLQVNGIRIEEKREIKKRLGRSTNIGDAIIYASILDGVDRFSAATADD